MKTQFASNLSIGAVVECKENTYIAGRAGVRVTVTKPGVSVQRMQDNDGKPWTMEIPVRKSAILEDSPTRIRYNFGKGIATWEQIA